MDIRLVTFFFYNIRTLLDVNGFFQSGTLIVEFIDTSRLLDKLIVKLSFLLQKPEIIFNIPKFTIHFHELLFHVCGKFQLSNCFQLMTNIFQLFWIHDLLVLYFKNSNFINQFSLRNLNKHLKKNNPSL
ncbi:hypothetical protein MpV1_040 [Micromonas sp. RCC1109 virus MpV1]|uniref:hypothetical protein n=1 Tax=Micromonas sp. RCC1109 virus MpV1 TaxID=880161 RepID=UPI0001EF4444|nr:hypothetical protein MpV1_040 [Micromonas sp. RCC1109 virus MpV1]ADQ90963.1 hypothetical protein MpV1_040 [Micromonas sp. RCC1109 virus MpV1]